jgi:hypothetical protein
MLANYVAPATVARFMLDTSLVRCIVGPVGSGKTSGALFELFRRSVGQEPGPDGIRRTRFAIIRNTLSQLKMTVLPDARALFGEMFDWKVSESMGMLSFRLADGTTVRSEWLFIPLDDPDDVRRLLSLQLTGAWVEEFRETDFGILSSLIGRVGRYPTMGVRPTWEGVLCTSNPYPDGSAWHEALELDLPEGWAFYRQPSGLSPEAENVDNLPADYYDRLCNGASEAWIEVHVLGRNGADASGQAVFGRSFSYGFHVAGGLVVRERAMVFIGFDTDRNPAAVFMQRGMGGGLRVLDAIAAEGTGLELFIETMVKPLLYERYASCPVKAFADPSAVRRSSFTEESQIDSMVRIGIDTVAAPTNALEPRLRAVDEVLLKQIGGGPAIVFDNIGAGALIQALQHSYRYARSAKGELSPSPMKSHPHSDLVDALGYVIMGSTGMQDMGNFYRRATPPKRVGSAGW